LVAAALLSTAVGLPASAATPAAVTLATPNRFVSGWVPYWQATSGGATVTATVSTPYMSDVSLFGASAGLTNLATTAHAAGLPVFQTLFSSSTAGFEPAAVSATVGSIVNGVVAGNFDGVDIDYEFVWSVKKANWGTISPKWVAFIASLSSALHARGKLLSVTIPPTWNAGASGYTVYAQPLIAPYVDRLRLMVYDWSITNPGPIAPDFWVKSVIDYSTLTAKVPPKKLQLGVPAYGRHWTTKKVSTQVCPDGALKSVDSITMRETAALATAHAATKTRSYGEVTFGWDETVKGLTKLPPPYVPSPTAVVADSVPASSTGLVKAVRLGVPRIVTCTVRHTVYVPDATTITASANTALASGWSGITMWTFGYETPDVFDTRHLATVASQRALGSPVLTVQTPTRTTNTITVKGIAFRPQFDLPVTVQVSLRQGSTILSTTNVVANVARTDATIPTSIGPFHGFDRTVNLPPTADSVCVTQLAFGGTPLGTTTRCVPTPAA
jgi:spore germination protein YaaH